LAARIPIQGREFPGYDGGSNSLRGLGEMARHWRGGIRTYRCGFLVFVSQWEVAADGDLLGFNAGRRPIL
jgi:hypothetical protein